MPLPSTFRIGRVLDSLGVKSTETQPPVGEAIQPVVSFGSVESFAQQAHEARQLYYRNLWLPGGAGAVQCPVLLHSLAPGGIVIEQISGTPIGNNVENLRVARSPEKPYSGTFADPAQMDAGGLTTRSIIETLPGSGATFGLPPDPFVLGGSGLVLGPNPIGGDPLDVPELARTLLRDIWVPAGWWFWVVFYGTGFSIDRHWSLYMRWRELAEISSA